MTAERRELSLGDLGRIVTGKTPSTKDPDNFDGDIPFVTPSDMDGRKTINSTLRYLTRKGAASVRNSRIPSGSVMVSCIGSDMGKAAIAGCECFTNQQINSVIVDDDFCSQYIYYDLSTRKAEFQHIASGAAQPILNKTHFSEVRISLPPLSAQMAISTVLGALDDKIELNRRMNATLEAMARALFQSWFVDFDPVRAKQDGRRPTGLDEATAALFPNQFQDSELGHVPQGWGAGSILNQANLLSGGTPKTSVADYWDGEIPWASAKDVSQCGEAFLVETERQITQRGLEESATKLIPESSTVVVARGATTGRLTMFGKQIAMNQTCYALHSKISAPFSLYCHARDFIEHMVRAAHGSVFDTITTRTFETTRVLLPPVNVQHAFDEKVAPLFQSVLNNLHQSSTLATLRDALLPKLLSGEVAICEL